MPQSIFLSVWYGLFSALLLSIVQAETTPNPWPPSGSLSDRYSVICLGPESTPSFPRISSRWNDGLTEEFLDNTSPFSQIIRTMCDADFRASLNGQQWPCKPNENEIPEDVRCERTTEGHGSRYYDATYFTQDPEHAFSNCFNAAFAIITTCRIGSGDPDSFSSGSAFILNPLVGEAQDRYTLTITPKLPFPSCSIEEDSLSSGQDAPSVSMILQNICGDGACQETGAQFGCRRTISQVDYAITGRRQNYASDNFNNCAAGMGGIIQRCYQKGRRSGSWALDPTGTQGSQEFYSLNVDPIKAGQADT